MKFCRSAFRNSFPMQGPPGAEAPGGLALEVYTLINSDVNQGSATVTVTSILLSVIAPLLPFTLTAVVPLTNA